MPLLISKPTGYSLDELLHKGFIIPGLNLSGLRMDFGFMLRFY